MDPPTTPKVLVVFFSRSDATRQVAEAIAHAAHADLEELKEPRSRQGILGWLRSGYEATYRLSAEPLPLAHDPKDYQIVFVGSPTWNKALASPVRGFLQRHAGELPDVALFATSSGHGAQQVVEQMASQLGRKPLAQLPLSEPELSQAPAVEVGAFVEATMVAWERLRGVAGAETAQCCASG